MACLSEGSECEVRKLPQGRICNRPDNSREVGIRVGPSASGAAANSATPPKSTHPDARKRSIRELMGVPQARGPFGYPPTMRTDACVGYLRMGCQSAGIAMSECDAGRYVLARFESTA